MHREARVEAFSVTIEAESVVTAEASRVFNEGDTVSATL